MKKLIYLALFSLILSSSAVYANTVKAETLTDYYREQGQELLPVSERAGKATECGIFDYKGLYNQNIRLLACLRLESQLGGNVPTSGITWNLASPITAAATSITLIKVTDIRNNVIEAADLPTKIYLTLEPTNTDNTEGIVCPSSGYTSSTATFTGCTRGLKFSGSSETSVTNNKKPHASGAIVVISNWGQFYSNFVDIDGNQTIGGNKTSTGQWIFSQLPSLPSASTTVLSTLDNQFITKYHAETLVAGGLSSLNVGTGKTLRANGTAPETLDVNTSTASNISFIIENGYFEVATGTNSRVSSTIDNLKTGTNNWSGTNSFLGTLNIGVTSTADLVNGLNANSLHYHLATSTTFASSSFEGATWTVNHSLGIVPKKIKATMVFGNTSNECLTTGVATINNGSITQGSVYFLPKIGVEAGAIGSSVAFLYCKTVPSSVNEADVRISSVTNTAINFTRTYSGSAQPVHVIFEIE
jgi:hypothetical protein